MVKLPRETSFIEGNTIFSVRRVCIHFISLISFASLGSVVTRLCLSNAWFIMELILIFRWFPNKSGYGKFSWPSNATRVMVLSTNAFLQPSSPINGKILSLANSIAPKKS